MANYEFSVSDAQILQGLEAHLATVPHLLTATQAAEALNTSERVIADATRRGDIRAVKIGRHWQYPRSALIAWVARQMNAIPVEAIEPDLSRDANLSAARSRRARSRSDG